MYDVNVNLKFLEENTIQIKSWIMGNAGTRVKNIIYVKKTMWKSKIFS